MKNTSAIAITVLSVAILAQWRYSTMLARRLSDLSALVVPDGTLMAAVRPAKGRHVDAPALGTPPAFVTTQQPQAIGLLQEALTSPEGQEQLKGVLASLKEDDRKRRMLLNLDDETQREEERLDRILRWTPSLTSEERLKLRDLYRVADTSRRQALELLKAGGRTTLQVEHDLSAVRGNMERSVRAVLGDARRQEMLDRQRIEREDLRLKVRKEQAGSEQRQEQKPGQQTGVRQQPS